MTDQSKRVIKKYPNRRLYDTAQSKYVTLNDVRQLVLDGVSFCVIDKKSGDDITRNILLQIIIEQEEEGEPLFTTDALEQIIGFYGDSVQGVAGDFLGESLKIFQQQQKQFQTQMQEAMQTNPMSSVLAEMTQRNLELWKSMQQSLFQGLSPNNSSESDERDTKLNPPPPASTGARPEQYGSSHSLADANQDSLSSFGSGLADIVIIK